MRSRMIFYVAGIAAAVCLPALTWAPVLLLPPLFIWSIARQRAPVIAYLLGAAWALSWSAWQLDHRLDSHPLKSDWQIEGRVVGLPVQTERKAGFELLVERFRPVAGGELLSRSPRTVRLSWYRPDQILQPGMRLTMVVRMKPPHGLSNPAAFDYELWLLAKGIDATGYVREMRTLVAATDCRLDCWRSRLLRLIETRYGGEDIVALLRAVTLGARDGFSDSRWEQLQATGTVHLAVISGLHIGSVALLAALAVRLGGRLLRLQRGADYSRFAAVLFAGLYMLLAGAGLPTQRAFVMVAVFMLAQWRLWHFDLWSRWWLAMAAVLTLSPVAVHQAGFWLSFIAVAVLLWCAGQRVRDLIGWRAQTGIFLVMTPLLLQLFGGASLIAPVVNLVAIPLMTILLAATGVDLLLAGLSVDLLMPLVESVARLFWWLIGQGAALQGDLWRPPAFSWWSLALALIGTGLLMQPRGFPARWLGMVLWLPLVLGAKGSDRADGFEAWVYDVGQGLAVLVHTGGRYLLYDTGPGYPSGQSALPNAVLPHLRMLGLGKLNRLVLSHDDLDHTGGYRALRKEVAIGSSRSGGEAGLDQPNSGACHGGQQWRWGATGFRMLAGSVGDNDNNRSCVLWIGDDHCSLMLTGDVDASVESQLMPPREGLDWLVASHHGSRTGSSEEFLQRWRPENVIFSAGYLNRFRHPAPDVVARVEAAGARHFNTASQGAIHLHSAGGECRTEAWRDSRKRFWSGY